MKIKNPILNFIISLFKKYWSSRARRILFFYLVILLMGTTLLILPFSYKSNDGMINSKAHWNFWNSLFTSVSAMTNTGLTVVSPKDEFTIFGSVVIIMLMQIGGIGIISLKVMFFFFIRRKLTSNDIELLESENGLNKSGSNIKMIRITIIVVFFIEIFGTILFNIHISAFLHQSYGSTLFKTFFLSVSSLNNSGFDLFGSIGMSNIGAKVVSYSSLVSFSGDALTLLYVPLLIILGSIGFPLYFEMYENMWVKKFGLKSRITYSWTLKFILGIYFLILVFGFIALLLTILLQNKNIAGFSNRPLIYKILNILFLDISTRNAGFSTFNINLLHDNTKVLISILMWIGASPFSTGGGIRTTTLAIAFFAIFSLARGRTQIKIRKRAINKDLGIKSILVILTSLIILLVAMFIISFGIQANPLYKENYHFTGIILEITSAFGTTGLSSGLTSYLPIYSLLTLCVLMIIGQLTISNSLMLFYTNNSRNINMFQNKEIDILIG